jgi:hypothetical protein
MLIPDRWSNKDPADVVDEAIDAREWCASKGVTLSSAAFSVAPAGLTLGTITATGNIAAVRLAAGSSGTEYVVTGTLTMSDGQVVQRDVKILVANQ